jgi:deazaflavin-dependent oxidoreductase (nitroreductase family)
MSSTPSDFNAQVIEQLRANEGRVSGPLADMPLLVLHHTGARSGVERVAPLAYLRDGERYVIFGSKAGAPEHPAWYHNVKAHPEVEIEVDGQTIAVYAEEAVGEERDRLFDEQVGRLPQFADYTKKTDRVIPVVVLTPAGH